MSLRGPRQVKTLSHSCELFMNTLWVPPLHFLFLSRIWFSHHLHPSVPHSSVMLQMSSHTRTYTPPLAHTQKPHSFVSFAESCLHSLIRNTHEHTSLQTQLCLYINTDIYTQCTQRLLLLVISPFSISSVLLCGDFPSDANSSSSHSERPSN